MQKSTEELLHHLAETDDIYKYLDDNQSEILKETPQAYLNGLLQIKNITLANVAQRSGQGNYVYKVFQGTRKASRDILIAIAVGMGLDVPETQLLLRIARAARLDPRSRRDSVIIYSLNNTLPVETVNELLYDAQEATL